MKLILCLYNKLWTSWQFGSTDFIFGKSCTSVYKCTSVYICTSCTSQSLVKFWNSIFSIFIGCWKFFSTIWGFFEEYSLITGEQEKEEAPSLTSVYHFHPFPKRLDISRAITADSSPLHIASSRTQTGNLWFPSVSRWPLSYAPLRYH